MIRHALVTAALLALLGLAGWSLYATGFNDGYEEATFDLLEEEETPEVSA